MTTTTDVMPCPICRTQLVMSERQGIEIDTCPTCRGVWLDRGELDKIIERAADQMPRSQHRSDERAPIQPRSYGYDDDHRGFARGKRKKSFLSELFD